MSLHHLFDFGGGILRRLFMVERVEDFDAGIFFGGVLCTLRPLLEVRRILIPGENGDNALAAHDFGQFIHDLLPALHIVNAEGDKAFAGGRIGIERGNGHTILHRGIDGVGELVGVGTTDRNAVGAGEDELLDGFGLLLRIFLVWCAPIDFDGDAVISGRGLWRLVPRRRAPPGRPGCLAIWRPSRWCKIFWFERGGLRPNPQRQGGLECVSF